MADVVILQEGEEPSDLENYVLVEQIPAPRGAPRYRIARTWHSQPPIYMRHPLGTDENGTHTPA
jgi:hypothetical protein